MKRRSDSLLYLVGFPKPDLPLNQLPLNIDVLRVICFLKQQSDCRNSSVRDLVACSLTSRGDFTLICRDPLSPGGCALSDTKCLVGQIYSLWQGFKLQRDDRIIKKVLRLY